MTDRSIDAVPEADLIEQTVPAYPENPVDDPEAEADTAVTLPDDERSWEADEADVIEQSIPVPLDDDYDEGADSEY
ncbi:hypothetical protein HLB23_37070 [Nocardia uniformis]|uniref:Uncharacterized protein n=1 Tax=Nocardia uniformis TaxID=53432 RepID=A0A849CCC3_9NOCA|nr:hypothetical protein [Nocardia uniformis]NNH75398.1 hypothetical protein [Nocardia uniformis]